MNPLDKEGNVMRCHEYDLTERCMSNCPHQMPLGHVKPSENNKESETVHEVYVTLMSSEPDHLQFSLVRESFAKGIFRLRLHQNCFRRHLDGYVSYHSDKR